MKKIFLLLLFIQFMTTIIQGQSIDYINTTDTYEGCADIVARTRVTLKPGFRAFTGCRVHAYTDNITPPPSNEYNPDTGGISIINDNPNSGVNYIKTTTLRAATNVESNIVNTPRIVSIEYINGWGNPIYTIGVKASPNKKDIVSNIYNYDSGNRLSKVYLPYESDKDDGSIPNDAFGSSTSFYSQGVMPTVDADEMPWKDLLYDNSPLNRTAGEYGVGKNWKNNNHPTTILYKSNTEPINSWKINTLGSCVSVTYPAGTWECTETTDEDGLKNIVYTDKLGRVVFVKNIGFNVNLRTAYVYDNFNRLRYVVPPQASSPNNTELCYSYTYDKKGRVTLKTIPSHGSERYVYDKRDRIVMSQDDNQYNRNEWSFMMYDAHDRIVLNGYVNSTQTATYLQQIFNNQNIINEQFSNNGTLYGYQGNSFPNSLNIAKTNVMLVNWYDTYDFLNRLESDYLYSSNSTLEKPLNTDLRVKGLLTGYLDKALLPNGDIEMVHVNYYDSHERIVYSVNDNHLGGKTFFYFNYTFSGELEKESVSHFTRFNATINLSSRYEYDHCGRIVKEYFKCDKFAEFVARAYEYDAVGNLANTYLHSIDNGKTFQQKLKNHYNIRGWLTNVNDFHNPDYDLFTMMLGYDNIDDGGGRYNGSLSMEAFGGRHETPHGYSFMYKGMDWLHKSIYREGYNMNQNIDAFAEAYDYDSNGNITGLIRKNKGIVIDNLKYNYYTGTNKISGIKDMSRKADGYPITNENYLYDHCGNTTYDPSKMAYVSYNRQNKPTLVSFSDDDFITYSYTSTGTKLRRKVTSMSSPTDATTDYLYNFMYEDGKLICIFAPFGRVLMNTKQRSKWQYHYTISDHLGNTRIEFVPHNGGQPEVVQSASYYPYGYSLRCDDYGSRTPNRHLFGGKELQDQTLAGITFGWYDFEARTYDPIIGRFMQTDPMAEKYYGISPYAYCANNPIKYVDPFGMKIEPFDKGEEEAYKAYRDKVFGDKKYKDIQDELIRLEEAEEVFRIRMGDNITNKVGGGNFTYNKETDEFDVNIADYGDFNTMGKLAHELKHADQYMDGKLGFDLASNGLLGRPIAYDIYDEYEAFERQSLFDKNTISNDVINDRYKKLNQTHITMDNIIVPYNKGQIIDINNHKITINEKIRFIYHGWKNDIK